MRRLKILLFMIFSIGFSARAQTRLAHFKMSSDSVCTGSPLTVTYDGAGATGWAWTFKNGVPASSFSQGPFSVTFSSPSTVDSVILIATDGTKFDTFKLHILVKQTPTAHFAFGSAAGCAKNYVTVTANGSAGGNAKYIWKFPGSTGDTGSGQGPIYVRHDTGWQFVTLQINDGGCFSAPFTDSIYFDSLPRVSFTAEYLKGCTPLADTFANNSHNAVAYQWKFGDSTISSNLNPLHIYGTFGHKTVTLVATSANGCVDSLVRYNYIDVIARPIANFYTSPLDNAPIQLRNACLTFYDESIFADCRKWKFGDTFSRKFDSSDVDSSLIYRTKHCYLVPGNYFVCLYACNFIGCIDSVCHTLKVIPNNEVYIPNTFTPNGDNRDDIWLVFGNDIDRVDMKIYDRWGELIYYAPDFFAGWDGNFNGKPCITGVYSYVATVYRSHNRVEHYKGGVTLLR